MDADERRKSRPGNHEPPADLVAVAKVIIDLHDLVRLVAKGLSRAKPWQRQLDSRLAEVEGLLQVLRMTVALERADHEILRAAETLCAECGSIGLAISGSRADQTTKAAVRLIAHLATDLRDALVPAVMVDLS
jgi:hypothetical protein